MQMEKNQQEKPSSSAACNGLQHTSITSTPITTPSLSPHPEPGKGSQEASNTK
jgi:hypothetical protein